MKTISDPRHQKRIKTVETLYAWDCQPHQKDITNITHIIEKLGKIDDLICKNAPRWPITKINKIDLAILRLAFYELLFTTDTPPKVIIDEAVEIAKEFGNDHSYSFVNAVLGVQMNDQQSDSKTI